VTTLAPNGFAARSVLAILAAVGILYANFGPLIVSGLAHGDFTSANAGYLVSINLYGTAFGGMLIIFVIRRVPWRAAATALLLAVLATDLGSAWLVDTKALHVARFLHGVAGGALIGVFGSVIARTISPERTFALTIVIQLVLGGIGTAVLVPVVARSGVTPLWLSLAAFTALGLALLPWLDRYPDSANGADGASRVPRRAPWLAIALGCAALFVYQAGQMAVFSYVIELGEQHRLAAAFIGNSVAAGLWIGGPAGLLVAWWSTRSGRWLPSAFGTLLSAASVALFFAPGEFAYLGANLSLSICFSLTIPYLLGVVAEMDDSGQIAALGGFVSSFGLATGPAIAATILGDEHYERVLWFSVIALACSALIITNPARLLDRRAKHGRVVW
jgi:predicted MFS family arabinose efflux permease